MRRIPQFLAWAALLASSVVALAGPQVPVVRLDARPVSAGFDLDGVVEPVRQATVSAQASGRIASLRVKAGDRVKAGQVLAVIDDRESRTGVERSQAQVAQTEAELANAQAQFQRTRDLRAQGFVSAAALDQAQAQLKSAQAAREGAQAGARQASLGQSFTQVTAPFEGYVLELLSQAGDLALPGKPVMTVYAPAPLRVVVQVPASMAGVAQTARQVRIEVPPTGAAPEWVSPAGRQQIPAADPVSQTLTWKFDLPASASRLLAGQQTRVRFVGAEVTRPVVPARAVLRRGELTAVYVAQGTGFVLRAVRLGADHGEAGVEVLAGLRAGEQVAVDAVQAGLTGAQPQAGQ